MKVFMATWLFDRTLGRSSTKLRSRSRLLSFYFIKEQELNNEQFQNYITTGRLDPRKKK